MTEAALPILAVLIGVGLPYLIVKCVKRYYAWRIGEEVRKSKSDYRS